MSDHNPEFVVRRFFRAIQNGNKTEMRLCVQKTVKELKGYAQALRRLKEMSSGFGMVLEDVKEMKPVEQDGFAPGSILDAICQVRMGGMHRLVRLRLVCETAPYRSASPEDPDSSWGVNPGSFKFLDVDAIAAKLKEQGPVKTEEGKLLNVVSEKLVNRI